MFCKLLPCRIMSLRLSDGKHCQNRSISDLQKWYVLHKDVAGKTSHFGGFQHQAGVLVADDIAQCFGELQENFPTQLFSLDDQRLYGLINWKSHVCFKKMSGPYIVVSAIVENPWWSACRISRWMLWAWMPSRPGSRDNKRSGGKQGRKGCSHLFLMVFSRVFKICVCWFHSFQLWSTLFIYVFPRFHYSVIFLWSWIVFMFYCSFVTWVGTICSGQVQQWFLIPRCGCLKMRPPSSKGWS